MATAKAKVKTAEKKAEKSAKSMAKTATRTAKRVSANASPRLGEELANVASGFNKVLKKSHVKEGFNGTLEDAEKFMKNVMNDNDSLKKFVKIVKKSFSKTTSKRA
jgi:hypothetical protein